eukprot:358723-Chlamydomonas_euryale.AAC.8
MQSAWRCTSAYPLPHSPLPGAQFCASACRGAVVATVHRPRNALHTTARSMPVATPLLSLNLQNIPTRALFRLRTPHLRTHLCVV